MNYLGMDTEGSGLFDYTKPADAPGQPRMAAIGLIFVDQDLVETERHSFLIRPDGWTFEDHSEAARVNGLTHARLMADGIPVREALAVYNRALDQRRIIVGHNVLHDLKMMRAELRHAGYQDRFMESRYVCTMQGSRQIVDARTDTGKKKAPRLEEACAHFNIPLEEKGAHTGIGGAERAMEILRRLRDLKAFPDYKDPYDKGAKPAPKPRRSSEAVAYAREQMAMQDIPDFLGHRSGGIEE